MDKQRPVSIASARSARHTSIEISSVTSSDLRHGSEFTRRPDTISQRRASTIPSEGKSMTHTPRSRANSTTSCKSVTPVSGNLNAGEPTNSKARLASKIEELDDIGWQICRLPTFRKDQEYEVQAKLRWKLYLAKRPLQDATKREKEAEEQLDRLTEHTFRHRRKRKPALERLQSCRAALAKANEDWLAAERNLRQEYSVYRQNRKSLGSDSNTLDLLHNYKRLETEIADLSKGLEQSKVRRVTSAEKAIQAALDRALADKEREEKYLSQLYEKDKTSHVGFGYHLFDSARRDIRKAEEAASEARQLLALFGQRA